MIRIIFVPLQEEIRKMKKPLRKTSHYTVLEVDTSLDKYLNAPIFTKKLARVNQKLEKVGLPKTIVN